MTTITGLTAERMLEIEAESIVDGGVVGDNLILTKHDGSTINAGSVRGPAGPTGPVAGLTMCSLKRVTDDFALTNGAWTTINWDGEESDTHNLHDLVTNPQRITVDSAGIWLFTAKIVIHGNYAGMVGARIQASAAYIGMTEVDSASAASEWPTIMVTGLGILSAGDSAAVDVWQNGGKPLSNASTFKAVRLGTLA